MPYFINKLKQRIAYKTVKGRGLGIIFIHGLNSDMKGKKALAIEKYSRKHKCLSKEDVKKSQYYKRINIFPKSDD